MIYGTRKITAWARYFEYYECKVDDAWVKNEYKWINEHYHKADSADPISLEEVENIVKAIFDGNIEIDTINFKIAHNTYDWSSTLYDLIDDDLQDSTWDGYIENEYDEIIDFDREDISEKNKD